MSKKPAVTLATGVINVDINDRYRCNKLIVSGFRGRTLTIDKNNNYIFTGSKEVKQFELKQCVAQNQCFCSRTFL